MPAGAREVARVAGVSLSTVSRTLARPDQVAPETREKVLAAARSLGYRPSPAARGLTTGRTQTLGLVVPDLENPYFTSVVKGAQRRALSLGYALIVADTDEDSRQEVELVRSIATRSDGVILCSPRTPEQVIVDLAADTTMVLLNRPCGDIPTVTIDNRDGVRQALDHLRALGHRRIAYVGGPRGSWSDDERLAAVRDAEHESDLEMVELGSFRPYVSGGVAAADLVLASGATAVLTYNDLLALGVLDRLRQRGVDVPGRMSVVGIDNIPAAALTTPPLTSVEVPRAASGSAGVDLLLQRLEPERTVPPAEDMLAVQLVVRGSTGTAP